MGNKGTIVEHLEVEL